MARTKKISVPQAMLAGRVEDRQAIRYPVYASEKLDGIRAIVRDGVVFSRSMKPIPNTYVQKMFSKYAFFDGELVIRNATKNVFAETQSAVMSVEGNPDVVFHVFDIMLENVSYDHRYKTLLKQKDDINDNNIEIVPHHLFFNLESIENFEKEILSKGGEGVMLNDPNAFYKYGRSSWKEAILLKLKPWDDAEATVVGFKQKHSNQGEIAQDFAGNNYRVYKREDMVPVEELGALILKFYNGSEFVEFNIGTGFDAIDRKEIWENQQNYIGKIVKFRYQGLASQGKPRNPAYIGIRHEIDII